MMLEIYHFRSDHVTMVTSSLHDNVEKLLSNIIPVLLLRNQHQSRDDNVLTKSTQWAELNEDSCC